MTKGSVFDIPEISKGSRTIGKHRDHLIHYCRFLAHLPTIALDGVQKKSLMLAAFMLPFNKYTYKVKAKTFAVPFYLLTESLRV